MIFRHIFLIGNHISFNRSAVYKKGFDAFLRFGRIINVNMINGTAEMPRYGKSGQGFRNTRINAESVKFRADTKNIL